jgi:ferritin-like metal-binding protein YciE
METFEELRLHFLKDMYFAEQQTLKSMPVFAAAAKSAAVKQVLEFQMNATRTRLELLQDLFATLGQAPQGVTCEAILGLLKECEELLATNQQPSAIRDAGLVACVQAILYYSLARYGSLLGWASASGDQQAVNLLRKLVDQARDRSNGLEELASTK